MAAAHLVITDTVTTHYTTATVMGHPYIAIIVRNVVATHRPQHLLLVANARHVIV